MGIDVYMSWPDQTEAEKEAQYTGFKIDAGGLGYLREAYHGDHYATQVLVPEAFSGSSYEDGGVEIPASVLADRVEAAVAETHKRYIDDPKAKETATKSIVAFVELAKRKERETGHPVRVYASW